jgi:RNA-directed DNA polymerase
MESEVMGNYHASFGERDGETRTVRIVKVRTVPTPLSPLLANIAFHG